LLQHCSFTLHVVPSVEHWIPPLELDALDELDDAPELLVDAPDDVDPEDVASPDELDADFPEEVLVAVVVLAPVPPPLDPHATAPTPTAKGIHAH
jgi:hypothetical protein